MTKRGQVVSRSSGRKGDKKKKEGSHRERSDKVARRKKSQILRREAGKFRKTVAVRKSMSREAGCNITDLL